MKKLYNKALMYQSFYNGKWALITGALLLVIFTISDFNSKIWNLKGDISALRGDTYYGASGIIIMAVCAILFVLYVMVTGFNKRNNIMFLTSGPYSKEEIKRNELLFLLCSLLFLVSIFAYINFCMIFKERELFSISSSLLATVVFDIFKLILFGVAFICYLEFMDMFFSNTFVTIISMVALPSSLFIFIAVLFNISTVMPARVTYLNYLEKYLYPIVDSFRLLITTDRPFLFVSPSYYLIPIVIVMSGIIIAFTLIKFINVKISLEKMSKIYTFPVVEKITYWVISLCLSSAIVMFTLDDLYYRYIYTVNNHQNLVTYYNNFQGTMYLILAIIIIVILAFIIQKVTKKMIKKFI